MFFSVTRPEKFLPRIFRLLAVFVLVGLAAWGGITLTRASGRIATIWLANGLLLGILLKARRSHWPAFLISGLVANVIANSLTGDRLSVAIGLALCNTVEILIAAAMLYKFCARPFDLRQKNTLGTFVVSAVVIGPLVSAAIAVLCFFSGGAEWRHVLGTWYVADALGMATVAPCVWALQHERVSDLLSRRKLGWSLGTLGLLALATVVTFSQDSYPLLFIVFPFLVLVVLRLRFAGAAVGVFIVAAISIGFTIEKHGPMMLIPDASLPHRMLLLQVYIAVALLTALPFAAIQEQRRNLVHAVRNSETLYRLLFERVGEAITLYPFSSSGVPGTFEKVNDMACRYFGYSREEMLQLGPLDLQGPQNHTTSQEIFATLRANKSNHLERTLLAKGNRPIPVEIMVHLIEIDGKTYGLSILRDISTRKRMEAEREQLILELRQALEEVKTLEGILPTCSYCKRIRDDDGKWHQFEFYIRERSEAEFSHGICPECADVHFGKVPEQSR